MKKNDEFLYVLVIIREHIDVQLEIICHLFVVGDVRIVLWEEIVFLHISCTTVTVLKSKQIQR